MKQFICPRCNNSDEKFIGVLNGKYYCRRCINMNGELADKSYRVKPGKALLDYELSDEQKELSNLLIENYKEHKNALIYAVTGAGKTELVFGLIEYCLNKFQHVGFAIPRVDIARELAERFKIVFKENSVCVVYGNHSSSLNADIIILTTHQLYRYDNYFDLLILDEIDAFPFKRNDLLQNIFNKSIRGNYVLMSATATEDDLSNIIKNNGKVFKLMKRYHGHKLPIPKYIKESIFPRIQILLKLKQLISKNKSVFIFVPTINIAEDLGQFLNLFLNCGTYVSSINPFRKEIIELFKEEKYKYLVTTSILERGVTVKNLQVLVFKADSSIYDQRTLVQIAGRVGRKKDAYEGEVIFYGRKKTDAIKKSIEEIQRCNKEADL